MIVWLLYRYRRIRNQRALTLGCIFLVLLGCIVANSLAFYFFDRSLNPDLTLGDALWYSVISITTIGYGDLSASSPGARIATILFIVVIGLSTFTLFFGMIIDWVTELAVRGQMGVGQIVARQHVIIVNFPGEPRVRQLIDELRSDSEHGQIDIVIVTDQLERLPFHIDGVEFVRGSPLQAETYDRACADQAAMAVVLATSHRDSNSDAVVASAISVINRINPSLHVVGECTDERHRVLFDSVRASAVVPGMRIIGNLLAQEVNDPGVARMVDVITSNREGDTLYSTAVANAVTELSYREFAKHLLDLDVNVLCVNRGDESHTHLGDLSPEAGDRVLYVAEKRMSWADLVQGIAVK